MSIADNIALDMAANGGVRIEIPIPGTNLSLAWKFPMKFRACRWLRCY